MGHLILAFGPLFKEVRKEAERAQKKSRETCQHKKFQQPSKKGPNHQILPFMGRMGFHDFNGVTVDVCRAPPLETPLA